MECRPSVPTWQSNTSDFKCKRQIKRRYEQRFYDVSGRSPWYRWIRAVDIVDIFLNASTGTASAWRRPPALLGRRPNATTGRSVTSGGPCGPAGAIGGRKEVEMATMASM